MPNRRWLALGLAYLMILIFALALQSLPLMLPIIGKEIPLSNATAGLVMGAFTLPGIFLPFAAARVAARIGYFRLAAWALLLLACGMGFFAASRSLPSLLAGRLVAGAGATALTVVAPLLVSLSFADAQASTAFGILNTGVPLGTALSAMLFPITLHAASWRVNAVSIAILSVAALWVLLALLRPVTRAPAPRRGRTSLPRGGIRGIALAWLLTNAGFLAFMTFAPRYFAGHGLSPAAAGGVAGVAMIVTIVASPLVGAFVQRRGRKVFIVGFGGLLMALAYLMVGLTGAVAPSLGAFAAGAVLLGIGISFVPVGGYSLVPEILPPDQVGDGFALMTAAMNAGGVLGPALIGALLDRLGFAYAFPTLAAISLLVAPAITRVSARGACPPLATGADTSA